MTKPEKTPKKTTTKHHNTDTVLKSIDTKILGDTQGYSSTDITPRKTSQPITAEIHTDNIIYNHP